MKAEALGLASMWIGEKLMRCREPRQTARLIAKKESEQQKAAVSWSLLEQQEKRWKKGKIQER